MTIRRCSMVLLAAAALGGCGAHAPAAHSDTAHGISHWSYAGADGPDAWSTIAPEYSMCRAGQRQSPVDLAAASTDAGLPEIEVEYGLAAADIASNGHTIQATFRDGGRLSVGGREYSLVQLHHHRPGEHTFNGQPADVEVHLVHRSADGELAVLGVMLDQGADANEIIGALIDGGSAERPLPRDLDPGVILPATLAYTTYDGSLTTPPCAEGVRWIVLRERGSVSASQLDRLDALLPPNARPALPSTGRKIFKTQHR